MTTSKKQSLRATAGLAVASFLFVHLLHWIFPSVFEPLNAQLIDRIFVFRSESESLRPPYDSTVVHVDLSDRTITVLQNFFLTRRHYGQVVRNLGEMQAAAQVWDYIFPKKTVLEDDQFLVDQTRDAGNVYFGLKFDLSLSEQTGPRHDPSADYMMYLDSSTWQVEVVGEAGDFYTAGNPIATMAEVANVSRGLGYLSLKFDRDGVFRRAPLLVKYGKGFYPSFAFRVVCDYLHVTPDRIVVEPGSSITLKEAHRKGEEPHDIVIPIDRHGNILINWVGPWDTMIHYNFADILLASDDRDMLEILAEEIRGKIVVVSEVATGSADVGPVPTDNNFPLSGLHANLIHTIINEQFLTEAGGWAMTFIEAGILLILIVLAPNLSSRWLSLSTLPFLAFFLAIAGVLFLYSQFVLEILRPSLVIVFGMFSILGYRFFTEEKAKEVLRRSFEAYFPPSVVKRIMANPDLITAAGSKKELTIMFTDIKNFTTYSSTMTPDEIQKILNEYFGAMVDIVFKYEGTVDKFIGDGLMVFFGDPEPQSDHALRCVRAAIEMQKKTRELKAKWEAQGKMPIRIRVGINTGPVVVGNMGSTRRLSYTVLGADVNLAQRLEANAPVEGIMISQRTYELVKDQIQTRSLEPIQVKGLDKPIQVYEVVVEGGEK